MNGAPEFDPAPVEKAAQALHGSRLPYGTHSDRWNDQTWQAEFWREAAEITLTAVADDLRAEAWAEGARRGYALYDMSFDYVKRENPYRIEGGA